MTTFAIAGRRVSKSEARAAFLALEPQCTTLYDGAVAAGRFFDAACEQSTTGYCCRDTIEDTTNITIRHRGEEQAHG